MCDIINTVITTSKQTNKPWILLYDFLINPCKCKHCRDQYNKNNALLTIRQGFRKKINKSNSGILKRGSISISDTEYEYLEKQWMPPLYDNINDLKCIFN